MKNQLKDANYHVNELRNENLMLERFKLESDKVGPLEVEY